jgi:hypothetical protein
MTAAVSEGSNLNRWDPWYRAGDGQQAYADTATYGLAAAWLDGLDVEDWGCGLGWFRRFHRGGYLGVDGTRSRWCDVHADLAAYRSMSEGVLLRHVLEHDPRWRDVLDNAVASTQRRLCVVLFTPPQDETRVLAEDVGGLGVPDIGFRLADVTDRLDGLRHTVETLETDSGYGQETVIRAERPAGHEHRPSLRHQEDLAPGERVGLVTAVYGGYDEPAPLPAQDAPHDAVIVADREYAVPGWRCVVEPRPHLTPSMAAKIPKCRPDLYTTAPVTVWLDASVQVRSPGFLRWARDGLGGRSVAATPHGWLASIAEEAAAASVGPGAVRYEGQDLLGQAERYAPGLPRDHRLWACGLIARRTCSTTRELGDLWLAELTRWGTDDQISFPYVAHLARADVGQLYPPGNPWHNELYWLRDHLEPVHRAEVSDG